MRGLFLLKTSSTLYQDVSERRRVRILDPHLHINDQGSLAVRENQHLARLGFLPQAARNIPEAPCVAAVGLVSAQSFEANSSTEPPVQAARRSNR